MPKEKDPAVKTLDDALKARTVPGVLYRKLDDEGKKIECFACGHRCKILDGFDGICRVRFNRGGTLYVPRGYVGALQVDPIEKKPFFHAFPGAVALSFGMLGCDFHCGYCFPGETTVVTDRGPISLTEAFARCPRVEPAPGAEIGYPDGLRAIAGSGTLKPVRAVFKHHYSGPLTQIRPFYLPAIRCTPDHRVYATERPEEEPRPVEARRLGTGHYLAIPRRYSFSSEQVLDVPLLLGGHRVTYSARWKLAEEDRRSIAEATARGETSREIGARIGKDPSYVRHVRRKLACGRGASSRTSGPIMESGRIRFPNERRPGIPACVSLDAGLARLLGYYCAEGSVVRDRARPNSYALWFTFGPTEVNEAAEVRRLLVERFGVRVAVIRRETTLAVVAKKASLALLFRTLAGEGAARKHVPPQLWDAHRDVVEAFLDSYVAGDGHRYGNGKVSATTISPALAYGVAWLALKLGHVPSIYETEPAEHGTVLGRTVRRSPRQLTVVWYEGEASVARRVIETDRFHLVPIRDVGAVDFDGDVYNMEVEDEHNYLAGFFLVSNCQNWLTSQALRDASALAPPRDIEPAELVSICKRWNAPVMVTTYNEPLITSEWAVEVYRAAKEAGITCGYVSNGNGTPEVLEYIRPVVDIYKVDLKSFRDKAYRELGGKLDNVLNTIRILWEKGFWVEIVTLVVPGFNDSEEEIRDVAKFLASVSVDIPWHVTAFHKDYKMTDNDDATPRHLLRGCEIGKEAGLRYVYAGNLPGCVGDFENTRCPKCSELVIERYGYKILSYRLTDAGACPACGEKIAGFWKKGWKIPARDGGLPGRRPLPIVV